MAFERHLLEDYSDTEFKFQNGKGRERDLFDANFSIDVLEPWFSFMPPSIFF